MSWGNVIGGAVSLVGAGMSAKSARKDRRLSQQQIDRLNKVRWSPQTMYGLGGMSAGPRGFNAGRLGGIFDRFAGGAESDFDLSRMLQAQGNLAIPGLLRGMGQAGQMGDISAGQFGDLAFGGFQRGLQDRLFGAAGDAVDRLGRGFGAERDEYLDIMRQQAATQDQRSQDALFERMRSMGITRSTGGQRAFESFGRGLGEADFQRQIASFDLADRRRAATLAELQGFSGQGQALRGLEEGLMSNAFSRFGQSMGLVGDISSGIFNRGGALFNQGMQQLGGINNIQRMLMQLGEYAANLEQSRVDTEIRAAGGAAQAVNNMGASSGDIWGGFLGNLGTNLSGMDLFGRDDQGWYLGSQRGEG